MAEALPCNDELFSILPKAEAPVLTNLHYFPILSQTHQEIDTMAPGVNRNSHISNFIQGRDSLLPHTQAFPHETAPMQSAQAQAPVQAAPSPSTQTAATVAVPTQQTPPPEPAQAAPPSKQELLPHPATGQVSKRIINIIWDRPYTFVEGVAAAFQVNHPLLANQEFQLLTEVVPLQQLQR